MRLNKHIFRWLSKNTNNNTAIFYKASPGKSCNQTSTTQELWTVDCERHINCSSSDDVEADDDDGNDNDNDVKANVVGWTMILLLTLLLFFGSGYGGCVVVGVFMNVA